MSTLLWSLAKENPWPGLAVASLNLVVALSLVGLSLLLGVTISLLAWLHAFVDREAVPIKRQAQRRGPLHDVSPPRSRLHHLFGQRLARATPSSRICIGGRRPSEIETEAIHAIRIRPNSRRAVLDREGLQRGSRAL